MPTMDEELQRLLQEDPTLVLGAVASENAKIQTARQIEDLLVREVTKNERASIALEQALQMPDPSTSTVLGSEADLLATLQQQQQDTTTPAAPKEQALPKGSISDVKTDQWQDAGAGVGARRVNGQLEVSNVKDDAGNFTMDNSWYYRSSATHGTGAKQAETSVAQQFANIQELPTMEAKLTAFNTLQTSVAQRMAEAEGAALKQAEQKLGVDRLKALLAVNEAADRRNPAWASRQVDSPATASLRQQLDNATIKATSLASSFMKTNPEIAGLQSNMRTAEIVLQRSFASDQRLSEREAAKQMQLDLKAQQLQDSFRPQQYRRLRALDPELQTKSDKDIVSILVSGKKALSPEQMRLLQASDQELLQASLSNDVQAQTLLIQEEAARAGVDQEAIRKRLTRLSANMAPEVALKAIQQRNPDRKSEAYKIAAAPFEALVRGEKPSKEQAAQLQDSMFRIAMSGLTIANTQEWSNDVRSWVMDPAGLSKPLVDAVATANGQQPVSVVDMVRQARTTLDRSKWRAARDEMVKVVFNNRKQGLLTGVDADIVAQQIDLEFSHSRVADVMDKISGKMEAGLRSSIPGRIMSYEQQAYDYFFSNPITK